MPIRMVDDPQDPRRDEGGGRRPGFPGGGGMLGALLPLLLGLFRGKGGIVVIILIVGGYFLLNRSGGCNLGQVAQLFSQSGYSFNPNEFDKASVYEELDENNPGNALPEAVSLLKFAPQRLNQGEQGSCVAWSSGYAAQTIATAAATGNEPNNIAFSPSYLYNQIRLDECQGSYIQRAMETMQRNGGVPLSEYPYDDQDCQRQPSPSQIQEGKQNAIHGFKRLTSGDNLNAISIRAIKEHLAKDAPVVIGMMVGQSFMRPMMGEDLWQPGGMDESQMGMGGHAMCVIGYDDSKYGGAFQIMNSWGKEWGNNGIGWVQYGDFSRYVKEAYGIDPLPKRSDVANIPLECSIGLVKNDDGQYIPLRLGNANYFETVSPIQKGTRFKIEIKNETECYIYIFGMETDGSSYVLFPYTNKHSPYCGITGFRKFPRENSLMADDAGNKDFMAIVVSKDELDYNSLNSAINSTSGSDYLTKLNNAVQSIAIRSASFNSTADGRIYFKVDANDNKAVACVVAFDKN